MKDKKERQGVIATLKDLFRDLTLDSVTTHSRELPQVG